MGPKKAYGHIERILQIHSHSSSCLVDESAALPFRRAETQLYQRLVGMNKEYKLELEIEDVASTSHSGDIVVQMAGVKAIWDSKDYKRAVPWSQVRKLASDVRRQGGTFGVMVAPNGVAKMHNYAVCDGVPIHSCVPSSAAEFACLYLTTLKTGRDTMQTIISADMTHLFSLIQQMEMTLDELKETLSRQCKRPHEVT